MLLFGGFTRTRSKLRLLYKCVRVVETVYPSSFHGSGIISCVCLAVSSLGSLILDI